MLALKKFLHDWQEQRRLKRQITRLEQQHAKIVDVLNNRHVQNEQSRRNSDRQFLENAAKALAARTKRADQARLRRVEQELKSANIALKHHLTALEQSTLTRWVRIIIGEPEK